MLDKIVRFFDKFTNFIMIAFFVFLILVGGYALYDSYQIYDDTALDDEILNLRPNSESKFDLTSLRKVNPDIDGWVRIFETSIDYPVLHSSNNLDYLNQNYKGEYTAGGSIFVDYRNSNNFEDDYTILYGHNMMTGQMFSDIKNYEDPEYFRQHLYGVLYTTNDIYKMEVVYLARINAYQDDIYNLITYANGRNDELATLVQQRAELSNFSKDFDKLILLSTCDSYGSNDRTAILAKLIKTNKDEVKEVEERVKSDVGAKKDATSISSENVLQKFGLIICVIAIVIVAICLEIKIYKNNIRDKKNRANNFNKKP